MAAAVKNVIKSHFETGDTPTQSDFEEFIDSYVDGFTATVSPTEDEDADDGYVVGSHWTNSVTQEIFVCTDPSTGAAIWKNFGYWIYFSWPNSIQHS